MRCRGVVVANDVAVWEVSMESGRWQPYEEDVCAQIERGRQRGQAKIEVRMGAKSWRYEIDLGRMVQRNPQTGKLRPIRRAADGDLSASRGGKMSPVQLQSTIQFFVDLATLPPAPDAGRSPT
mmetsp:Transcript_37439/g.99038  ORF Transcript_37439/g.99038 Transcript_37439/m.99038 type:complete len:123 (+) Transcript_37439:2-370(+)